MHKKKQFNFNNPRLIKNEIPKKSYKIDHIINTNNNILDKLNNNLTDSQGLKNAYNTDNKIFVDGNKMYIAGTSNLQDVYDDLKIPFNLTRYSQRYKDADETLKTNQQVDTIIGHSLGSSVSLELNKNNNDKFKTRTYSSPVFDIFKNNSVNDHNLRFKTNGDVISMFDNNAININKNTTNPLSLHSYNNYSDTGKVGGGINVQIM